MFLSWFTSAFLILGLHLVIVIGFCLAQIFESQAVSTNEKMAGHVSQLMFDESGQPFIIIREQDAQKRITGVEALKVWDYFIKFVVYFT